MSTLIDHAPPAPAPTFAVPAEQKETGADEERRRTQRRTLRALVAAQVAGGVGLTAGITVAALIAVDLSGDAASSGLPEAAAVAGTAAAAMPLAALMRRRGRRPGLRLGWLLGAIGAAGVIVAAVVGSLPLLIACMVLVGGANASSDAARHVAADLAASAGAGRAIGTVVAATAVSAVAGPQLLAPASRLAGGLGLPPLTGPFVLAVAAFALAAAIVTAALRPDPLLTARRLASAAGAVSVEADRRAGSGPDRSVTASLSSLLRLRGVALGIGATAVANAGMLMLMAMTPVHLSSGPGSAEHHLGAIGLAISVHLAGMFVPSPLTGRLVDRIGGRAVVGLGAVLLTVAGGIAAGSGPTDVAILTTALLLLGLAWNACFVAGAALIADAVPATSRPRVQGVADTAAGVAAMTGGAASGVVTAALGFPTLGLVVAALGMVTVLVVVPRLVRDAGWGGAAAVATPVTRSRDARRTA